MIAYFECSSGISGDMILGSLVDAGVPLEKLEKELLRLNLSGYTLKERKVKRNGFKALKVDVKISNREHSRGLKQTTGKRKWKDVEQIIGKSKLSPQIKAQGLKIFRRLFDAEARVHGGRYDRIHLHELGAVDCLVDVFGTLIGIDLLGIDTIYSSPLNLGAGTVNTDHGILPVPAPATLDLLKNIPVYSSNASFELTTPTGAVLISSLATEFCSLPKMTVTRVGTGAGGKDVDTGPNILRLFLGETSSKTPQEEKSAEARDTVTVIETNIDDMNPQIYEHVMELLFKKGALDVFMTNIIMKKGRPGIKLTVLCDENGRDLLMDIILRETTSIGLRYYRTERKILQRELRSKRTRFGEVAVKVSQVDKKSRKTSVEYEDCRKIARKFNIPLIEVMKTLS